MERVCRRRWCDIKLTANIAILRGYIMMYAYSERLTTRFMYISYQS